MTNESDENNQNDGNNESNEEDTNNDSNSYTCNTMSKQISKRNLKRSKEHDESKDKEHLTIKRKKRKCKLTFCLMFLYVLSLILCFELA